MLGIDTIKVWGPMQGPFSPPAEAVRESKKCANGYRLNQVKFTTPEGVRIRADLGGRMMYAEVSLPRLADPTHNLVLPPVLGRLSLERFRQIWRRRGGSLAPDQPRVGRLDVALDLAWPPIDHQVMLDEFSSMRPRGWRLVVEDELVALTRDRGPRVKLYRKGEAMLRFEVSLNGSEVVDAELPPGAFPHLRLSDLAGQHQELAALVMIKALRRLQLEATRPGVQYLCERACQEDLPSATRLGVLGFEVLRAHVGDRTKELLDERTHQRWAERSRRIFGPPPELRGRLAIAIQRELYPWTAHASRAVEALLDRLVTDLEQALTPSDPPVRKAAEEKA